MGATLGEYRDVCRVLGGEGCDAVVFLDKKIGESPGGRAEVVVVDDFQMRLLLLPMLLTRGGEPIKEES